VLQHFNLPVPFEKEPPVQIMTAENFGEAKESIGYKGPAGSGKTTLAATWPTPIEWAHFDKNQKTIRDLVTGGLDARVYLFDTHTEFEKEFVAKVHRREFEAKTIVIDTVDFAAAMLLKEVQGAQLKMKIQDWGTILSRLRTTYSNLMSATTVFEGKPSYNIVLCYHLMDVTDDSGGLLKIAPKLPGQFKDELEAYLDTVLFCTAGVKSVIEKQPGGGGKAIASKVFECHSVPPTPHHTCKGGGLPPTLDGSYQNLMKVWGRTPE
jgi:hypothetical protein